MSLPSWVQPDEPKPAPGPLLVVQAFVNTYEAERGTDELDDPTAARRWLVEAGLVEEPMTIGPGDLDAARAAREAIRALLVASAEGRRPAAGALEPLELAAAAGVLRVGIAPAGDVELAADAPTGLGAAIVRLLLVIRDAQRDGSWARLKACRVPDCGWAYYDRSHSNRGRWCDMAVCGNRAKNRALRARRTATDTDTDT